MLLLALLLQSISPLPPALIVAAPPADVAQQESLPNPQPIYAEPFDEILPPVMPTDLSATPAITPSLPAEIILDLDRTVLTTGETARLTITVEGAYGTPINDVSLTLALPPGVMTTEGITGTLSWFVPAIQQTALFTQVVSLAIDANTIEEPTAVVPLDVHLTAPGYAAGYWTTTLGLTFTPAARNRSGRTLPTEVQQGVAGAVVQAENGLVTLLIKPEAATIDTAFTYQELYHWEQPGVGAALGSLASTPEMTAPVTVTTLGLLSPAGRIDPTDEVSATAISTPTNAVTYQLLLPLIANSERVSVVDEANVTSGPLPTTPLSGRALLTTTTWTETGIDFYYSWQLAAMRGNQTVTALAEPTQLTIDMTPFVGAGIDPETVQLWTRPDAFARWLLVRTDYDVEQQKLEAWVSALGQFGLGAGLSQRGDLLPSVVGVTPDRLTGGISLQYPIETPAGVGGLHPNLSFAYSSVSADDLFLDGERKYLSQSSGVGLGWSVAGSANYIVRTDNKLDNNTTDILKSFSLVLNGMRVGIRFEENEWRTDPETFYRVIWDSRSSNIGGVTDWGGWTLVAPDGTKYEFGDDADFNPASTTSPTVTYIERKSDGTYRLANQWYLRRVSDPLGNQIEYKYTTERSSINNDCDKKRALTDLWYTSAVYPIEISWNGNRSRSLSSTLRVLFSYRTEDRRDYQIQYFETTDCQQIKFAKRDWLQAVTVEASIKGGWVAQRSYQLENSYGFTADATDDHLYTTDKGRGVRRLLLHGLRVLGASQGLLQRHTFTYKKQTNNNPNQIHLITADNGWGGKVTYTLDKYRVGCHTGICGAIGRRDARFAVISTKVEDGMGNRFYTDYAYGDTAPADGAEWGHIGIEDGSAQFFGFQRSEATYYTANGKTTVRKWDAQDSWPPSRSDSGGADPRSGKPKRLETRLSATGAIVSVINYNWLAYRRVSGKWELTDNNQVRTDGDPIYPIIWVRKESEDSWTAGGNWETSSYGINGNGIGRQTKTLYDNTDSVRGYGNVLAVQEYSHTDAWITLADWITQLGDSTRKPIRETKTNYFPNTTAYLVNKPARLRIYAGSECKAETRYIYSNLNDNYTSQPSSTALLVKTEQALDACSDMENISTYDATWAITRMAYDPFGNQTILTQVGNASDGSQNLVINTTYDSVYQLFPVSQNLNGSSTYVETARYYGVNEISGHSGATIWGAMQEHCGVNEVCTRQVYDQFGRRARRWEGVSKSNSWGLIDDNALMVWLYATFGGGQSANTIAEWHNPRNEGNFVRKLYNGLGQLIQEQRPYQDWAIRANQEIVGQEILVDYLYDAGGNQTRISVPRLTEAYRSGDLRRLPVWTGGYTQTDYDARNLVTQTIAPNGEQQKYGYFGRAWTLMGLGRNGDPEKMLQWEESDPLGHPKYVRTYTAGASDGERVKQVILTHDAVGNLTDVSHPSDVGATRIRYDLGGRKISMDDPDLGYWRYQYDRQGKLIRQTDGRKLTTCLYYDDFGRLIGKYFRDDSNSSGTDIDACPPQWLIGFDVSYNYDEDHSQTNRSRGQLTSIWNSGVTPKRLTYNSQGLLAKEVINITGALRSYSTAYGYDSYLRPTTTTYPDDEIVKVSYNSMGLPGGLTSEQRGSTTVLVDSVTYDAAARVTQMRFPAGGNLYRSQTYWPWKGSSNNSNGRLYEIKVGTSSAATDRLWLRYSYDTFGNVGRVFEQYNGGSTAALLFCYDAQNRLVRGHDRYNASLTYPQNCAANNQTGRLYTYDDTGRLTKYEGAAMTTVRGHSTFPSDMGYGIDENGNYTYISNKSLDWDHENRLSRVMMMGLIEESYIYDADGQRVKKKTSLAGLAQVTYYVNAFYEETTDDLLLTVTSARHADPTNDVITATVAVTNTAPPGSETSQSAYLPLIQNSNTDSDALTTASSLPLAGVTKYYYFNGQRIAMRQRGALSYLHGDHLGSTVLETNGAGTVTTDERYYAYGRQRDIGPVVTEHKFTGQKLDGSGLYYYNSRYYNPDSGQFISPDLLVPNPSKLHSYNRYMYAAGNPMRYNDPTGHCENELDPSPCPDVASNPQQAKEIVQLAVSVAAGDLNDVVTVVTGYDYIYGQDVPYFSGQWWGTAVLAAAPAASGSVVRGGAQVAKRLDDALGTGVARTLDDAASMLPCAINSFSAETLVMTPSGLKPIAKLTKGELVLAYNEDTGEIGAYPIVDTISHVDPEIVLLTIDGETLQTTAEHPFYELESAPWLAAGQTEGRWTNALQLKTGDRIWKADRTSGVVQAVTVVPVQQQMYNLSVAEAHTFFVGDGQWLVHNCNPAMGYINGTVTAASAIGTTLANKADILFAALTRSEMAAVTVATTIIDGKTVVAINSGAPLSAVAKVFNAATANGWEFVPHTPGIKGGAGHAEQILYRYSGNKATSIGVSHVTGPCEKLCRPYFNGTGVEITYTGVYK